MNSTAPNCQDIVLPWFFESISLEVLIYGRRETQLVAFSHVPKDRWRPYEICKDSRQKPQPAKHKIVVAHFEGKAS